MFIQKVGTFMYCDRPIHTNGNIYKANLGEKGFIVLEKETKRGEKQHASIFLTNLKAKDEILIQQRYRPNLSLL